MQEDDEEIALADEYLDFEDFADLPGSFEIDEYSIMQRYRNYVADIEHEDDCVYPDKTTRAQRAGDGMAGQRASTLAPRKIGGRN